MDGLRLSLLIVGLAVVAGIVVFTWLRRRRASPRRDGLGPISDEPGLEPGGFLDVPVVAGAEFDSADIPVEDLGGVFVPLRDDSGKELSVDVSILAGLRATYESTVGGDSIAAQDSGTDVAPETLAPAPEASESMHDAPSFEREDVAEAPGGGRMPNRVVIDMSRPMILSHADCAGAVGVGDGRFWNPSTPEGSVRERCSSTTGNPNRSRQSCSALPASSNPACSIPNPC